MLKIAVFVSGRGSNLRAILESARLRKLVNVHAVISDKVKCPAFKIAEEYSLDTYCVGDKEGAIKNDYLLELLNSLHLIHTI